MITIGDVLLALEDEDPWAASKVLNHSCNAAIKDMLSTLFERHEREQWVLAHRPPPVGMRVLVRIQRMINLVETIGSFDGLTWHILHDHSPRVAEYAPMESFCFVERWRYLPTYPEGGE